MDLLNKFNQQIYLFFSCRYNMKIGGLKKWEAFFMIIKFGFLKF